jgi:hypothetical protein
VYGVPPVIINGLLGYGYEDARRAGGFSGLFAYLFAAIGIGLVLIALLVAITGFARRDAYGRMLVRRWFPVAGLLVLAFGVGAAIQPVRAALFPPPVVVALQPKVGSISLLLDHPAWLASTDTPMVGSCPLEPSGLVRFVNQEQVGTLSARPMSATLALGGLSSGNTAAELSLVVFAGTARSIQPDARIAEVSGGDYVAWLGVASISEIAADGTTGRATFADLGVTGTPPSSWPASLSGEISWICS